MSIRIRDCLGPEGRLMTIILISGWSLIYVGKCQKTENIFLPLWGGWQPLTRMNKHFSEFYSRHPKTTLPTTITFGSTTRKHK